MAGGANFFHRVISYVANELIVNGLANRYTSRYKIVDKVNDAVCQELIFPGFQRFAVRTSRRMEDISKMAEQRKREIADQIKDASKNFESFKNQ